MLGFRIRLLVVIALVALVGYSLQSGSWSRKLVEPALQVILHEDQWTKQILADFSERLAGQPAQPAHLIGSCSCPVPHSGDTPSCKRSGCRPEAVRAFPGFCCRSIPTRW